jgi:hypothetical protein
MAELTADSAGDRERAPGAARRTGKGLRTGALGLVSSIVIGTASVAPAYSLAATLGFDDALMRPRWRGRRCC